jgi:hypothetical protein
VNENQAGQVISRFLSSPGRIIDCPSQLLRLAGAEAGANAAHWPIQSQGLRTHHPQVFKPKKVSCSWLGCANQGTKDLPLPIHHLLPSLHHLLPLHILHGTFYYNTSHLRFVALHPFPPSNHLRRSHSVGICQHGKHRQRYIQSRCTNASALVVGTHSLARGQHTQWTVGRRETPSRRVGTVGLSKNQLRKRFDLRA